MKTIDSTNKKKEKINFSESEFIQKQKKIAQNVSTIYYNVITTGCPEQIKANDPKFIITQSWIQKNYWFTNDDDDSTCALNRQFDIDIATI